MSALTLLSPIVLIAAMLFAIAYARRQLRPRAKDDRDLHARVGMRDPAIKTPRKTSSTTPPKAPPSTQRRDRGIKTGDGADGSVDSGAGGHGGARRGS